MVESTAKSERWIVDRTVCGGWRGLGGKRNVALLLLFTLHCSLSTVLLAQRTPVDMQPKHMGNGATYRDTTTYSGADCGVRTGNALASVYALGGGTVDMRGEQNCVVGTQNLVIGDGTHFVTVYGPVGTVTESNGMQIQYNSNATMHWEQTTVLGAASVTAVQQAFNSSSVQKAHIYIGAISDSGTVVAGVPALQVGGPNDGLPTVTPAATTYTTNYLGYSGQGSPYQAFWPGALAHFAIYNSVLSPTKIQAHYAARTNASTYISTVKADLPLAYYPQNDSSGTTMTDAAAGTTNDPIGYNGTYVGGVGLGSAGGQLWVDGATYAALYNGTSQYATIPSNTWFSSGSYSLEGWTYTTTPPGPFKNFMTFLGSGGPGTNSVIVEEGVTNGMGISLGTFVSGVYTPASQVQAEAPQGAWMYWVWTYNAASNAANLYLNGTLIPAGTDVLSSTFGDIATGGADIGVLLNSRRGCICYNRFYNMQATGASFE